MSKLVIVESPAKAKTIGKYLGSDYVVKASMGHLRDLPKRKMSIDIEHDFQPEYVPIEGKDKIIKEIRSEIRKSDFVYLATDPDREGEAISWHIKELFKLKDKNSRRVTFNEITKQAVRSGIENPRDIDIDLVNAQQARRILDRIVGYQLSPFLWRKVKRGLSAGRVQSVATRLVVDRENEIRAFVPEEYWSIEALLQTADGGKFSARYYGDANGKAELKNEEQAMAVVNAVTGKPFTVGNIKRGKKKRTAAPPFITSTLQQEASRKLNMTPLGEGVTGLLVDEFKSVADYEFTANMEHELDEVEAGKLNYIQLLHNFYDGFEAALKQAEIDLEGKRIKIQDEVTDVICEKCGRNMVIKSGRFGKFLACPGFPECTNTKPITEDTGAACPVCGAKVVKKKSARGYVYYSCDTYPTCQFMTWDKPLKTKCPNCDSSLFRHTDRDSKEVTDVCLREGCGYKELVKEGLPPEETEKRRKMREARAAKAAERAAAKEAAEKNGETEEKVKKATKKATTKKSTAKKTLPWMTKTTNKFKKLKDEAVQELTAKQQEQYAKALAKHEAEKAAEKAKKAGMFVAPRILGSEE